MRNTNNQSYMPQVRNQNSQPNRNSGRKLKARKPLTGTGIAAIVFAVISIILIVAGLVLLGLPHKFHTSGGETVTISCFSGKMGITGIFKVLTGINPDNSINQIVGTGVSIAGMLFMWLGGLFILIIVTPIFLIITIILGCVAGFQRPKYSQY